MTVEEWIRQRVEFRFGFDFASRLRKVCIAERGEHCGKSYFYHLLKDIAREYCLSDCGGGGFACHLKQSKT